MNPNHHCVEAGKRFWGACQLLVLLFCQDHHILFQSYLHLEISLPTFGSASDVKLHLDEKVYKVMH